MKLILLSIVVFITLLLSFINFDAGVISHPGRLWANTDEPKIYYRLARSETHGMFSDAGLLGFCDRKLSGDARKKYSISVYLTGNCQDYFPYWSQSGVQGLIYSLINKFYKDPFIFKVLCASFFSAVLTLWFVWLCCYFGLVPSFLIMISILPFRDLTAHGDNIAQVLGATYLIMVAMFWAYKNNIKHLGAVAFIVVLLKLLLNGPEYIFSALLLPFLPLVFYAVLNRTPFRKVIQEAILIARGTVLACFVSFLILMAQVSVLDSPAGMIHYFILKKIFRTFPEQLITKGHHMKITITRLQLLYQYLCFPCISIGTFNISYGMMILFFCVISILAFYLYRRYRQRTLLALLATTWVSIFCPLSWILIAKGHSAYEEHDRLVWHMPFTLLGMALTIVTLRIWINARRVT